MLFVLLFLELQSREGKKSMFVRPHVALTTAMDTCQGDYHKFCFCRDVLGIEECREEIITICGRQRISHSAVCCCFSVFEGDVRKKWKCLGGWGWRKGGGGGGVGWAGGQRFPSEETSFPSALYSIRLANNVPNEGEAHAFVRCWFGWTLFCKIP